MGHGLFIDRDLAVAAARIIAGKYLCHVVPGFESVWRAMLEDLPSFNEGVQYDTLYVYLSREYNYRGITSAVRQHLLLNAPTPALSMTPDQLRAAIDDAVVAVRGGWTLDSCLHEQADNILENEDADAT